jgi:hypothetical protein
MVSPPQWSSGAARAHAVVVSVLTPAEVLIAARRLAGTRPHLAAVAGLVHPKDLWQLCRNELTGAELRIGGRAIRRHDKATQRGLANAFRSRVHDARSGASSFI